jgi:hypothetical protein
MKCKVYEQYRKSKKLSKPILIGKKVSRDIDTKMAYAYNEMDRPGGEMIVLDFCIGECGIYLTGIQRERKKGEVYMYHQEWFCSIIEDD